MNRRDKVPVHPARAAATAAPITELDALLDARAQNPNAHAGEQPGGRTVQPVHEDEVGYLLSEEPQPGSAADVDRVREAAYFRAEARGFEPGYELEDWLWAEREVQQRVE